MQGTARHNPIIGNPDRGAGRTEQAHDGGGPQQDTRDQNDVDQPSGKIVELAAEDQHAAGNSNCGKCDIASDRAGDRFLDLLKRAFPR